MKIYFTVQGYSYINQSERHKMVMCQSLSGVKFYTNILFLELGPGHSSRTFDSLMQVTSAVIKT